MPGYPIGESEINHLALKDRHRDGRICPTDRLRAGSDKAKCPATDQFAAGAATWIEEITKLALRMPLPPRSTVSEHCSNTR